MNDMKLLEVVTPPPIYHCFFTWIFREEKLIQVNMKNCCCCDVRKHREINNSEQYIASEISLKFDN